jgi:spore photoproduct lyase
MSVEGFRRLVISSRALQTHDGKRLHEMFGTAGLEVALVAEDEQSRLPASLDKRRSTLSVFYAPSAGWITKAEHGSLAVRRNEYYLHPVIGCVMGCTYCYLQALPTKRLPVRLFVGIASLLADVRALLGSTPLVEGPLLFCTGELADSLRDASLYPIASVLVQFFATQDCGRLELRTKSSTVESLLQVPHNGRTTVAFSLAPHPAMMRFEPGTASVQQRLLAAELCRQAGYPIAFKFEPLFLYSGWEAEYDVLLKQAATLIGLANLDHVSIGCLRWGEQLGELPLFQRDYEAELQRGVPIQYRARRRNFTLPRSERLMAYQTFRTMLLRHGFSGPIAWSLEEPSVIEVLATTIGTS